MPTQLTLDFTSGLQPTCLVNQDDGWLDVTDIARSVGFTEQMQISVSLHDALEVDHSEPDNVYDQRLFYCLWLTHLRWTFSEGEVATLNFFFERAGSTAEIRLRIRIEAQATAIRLDLVKAFESTVA